MVQVVPGSRIGGLWITAHSCGQGGYLITRVEGYMPGRGDKGESILDPEPCTMDLPWVEPTSVRCVMLSSYLVDPPIDLSQTRA